jgi:hypothetical protein
LAIPIQMPPKRKMILRHLNKKLTPLLGAQVHAYLHAPDGIRSILSSMVCGRAVDLSQFDIDAAGAQVHSYLHAPDVKIA